MTCANGETKASEAAGALTRVLVFGGTTEGRQLVAWLAARGTCLVTASSATSYGGSLIEPAQGVRSLASRLTEPQMEALMGSEPLACVVDATHPYASSVTSSIARAAQATATPLLRLVREGEPEGPWRGAADAAEAARIVAGLPGRVLLTTGTKDLPTFAAGVPDFLRRVYVRILPVAASLEVTVDLGLPASHVVAMQGPFSQELNCALIRQLGIEVLVTKASGRAGGFEEKVAAARECGCELVVIHRPLQEEGLSYREVQDRLADDYGL